MRAGRSRTGVAALALAAAILGGCGSSGAKGGPPGSRSGGRVALAAGCRAGAPGDQTATSARYVFLLHVESPQTMVMAAQVKAQHLKRGAGEVMIGGSMATMSAGSGGVASMRHLEVHICSRATGRVASGLTPSITLARSPGGTPRRVPVMVMEGIGEGAGDLHYGNNVPMRPGAEYLVSVRVGGERVVFHYVDRSPSG
jgi:hypothetical protein